MLLIACLLGYFCYLGMFFLSSSFSSSGFSCNQLLEDGVGGDDPGDGDDEAPPDGHVSHAPASKQDPSHRLARKRLW